MNKTFKEGIEKGAEHDARPQHVLALGRREAAHGRPQQQRARVAQVEDAQLVGVGREPADEERRAAAQLERAAAVRRRRVHRAWQWLLLLLLIIIAILPRLASFPRAWSAGNVPLPLFPHSSPSSQS